MTNPTESPKPEFKDDKGRTWRLELNVDNLRTIKATNGVDLGKVHDGKIFLDLAADHEKLAQVLWILCEEQATAINVDPVGFARLLGGDTIDAAGEALVEAIVLFTRRPMRGAIRAVIQTTLEAQTKKLNAVESWVRSQSDQVIEQEVAEATQRLSTLGSTLTS